MGPSIILDKSPLQSLTGNDEAEGCGHVQALWIRAVPVYSPVRP